MSLRKLKEKALQNAEVSAEYDKLEREFELIDTLITIRSKAGLNQEAQPILDWLGFTESLGCLSPLNRVPSYSPFFLMVARAASRTMACSS